MGKLHNVRHELMAQELAKGAAQGTAYRLAGFKPNAKSANRLANSDKIKKRVKELIDVAVVATGVDVQRVVSEMEKLAFSNMLDFMRINDDGQPVLDFSRMTREQAAAIAEITTDEITNPRTGEITRRTKFKLADKKTSLDSLGRHLGMFIDRKDIRVGGVMFHINQSDANL